MHITMAFVNPGDEVLVPDPGYPTYSSVTSLAGGKVRYYDLDEKDGWIPDIQKLDSQDLSKVKLMWINYPHMPTGTKGTIKLFNELVAFALKHNILLCNDNPYSFILNTDYHSMLNVKGSKDIGLELNSLSKSHNMAGWRIGMVAGHSEYIKNILKVKSNMDSGMYKPLQMAAAQALSCNEDWFNRINDEYKRRRELVWQIFEANGSTYDKQQSGLFVWAKIPQDYDNSSNFSNKYLYESSVFIAPGFIFGTNGEGFARISLCCNIETLNEALNRIKKNKN